MSHFLPFNIRLPIVYIALLSVSMSYSYQIIQPMLISMGGCGLAR